MYQISKHMLQLAQLLTMLILIIWLRSRLPGLSSVKLLFLPF